MVDFKQGLRVVGSALLEAGKFAGEQTIETAFSIDRDVYRHAAIIPALAYSFLTPRDEVVEAKPDDGMPPIIFVHGLGGARGNFIPLSILLRIRGRKRSYSIGFENDRQIDASAAELARYIEKVAELNSVDKVDLIGHSMGGLVIRLALDEHGMAEKVNRVLTLGAPHLGTYAARFLDGTKLPLRPDSPLIVRANSRPWPAGVKGVNFYSRNDLLILPHEAALVEGCEHIDLTPATHYSYLIDPKCLFRIAECMEPGPSQPAELAAAAV